MIVIRRVNRIEQKNYIKKKKKKIVFAMTVCFKTTQKIVLVVIKTCSKIKFFGLISWQCFFKFL